MIIYDKHEDGVNDLTLQHEFAPPSTKHKMNCSPKKDFDPLTNKPKQICIFIEQEEYIWGGKGT